MSRKNKLRSHKVLRKVPPNEPSYEQKLRNKEITLTFRAAIYRASVPIIITVIACLFLYFVLNDQAPEIAIKIITALM